MQLSATTRHYCSDPFRFFPLLPFARTSRIFTCLCSVSTNPAATRERSNSTSVGVGTAGISNGICPPPIFSAYGKKCVLLTLVCFVTNKFCVRSLLPSVYIQSHRRGWCSGLVVEYRTRHREVAGSTHTRSTASNLEQVANLLCAQANSASNPQRDWK